MEDFVLFENYTYSPPPPLNRKNKLDSNKIDIIK